VKTFFNIAFKQLNLSSGQSSPLSSHSACSTNIRSNDGHIAFISSDQNVNSIKSLTSRFNLDLSTNSNKILYKCPSIKSFQLPINDFKITDILKRHELTLPEINKQKVVYDPMLVHQLERQLPEYKKESSSVPMQCGKPLFSEIKWRKRMMNIKKRKKYMKKMFYVMQNRKQAKEKRYNKICELFKTIHDKKTEAFTPMNYINRELEKAKFFGYSCTKVYSDYRKIIEDNLKTFDEKYMRKFPDPHIPVKFNF
jgi:hypothetical protein